MSEPTMTDAELDEQIAGLEAVIETLRGLKQKPSQPATQESTIIITPSQASAYCGRTESVIRRDAERHPYDAGGFGMKIGLQWGIHLHRYIAQRGKRSA